MKLWHKILWAVAGVIPFVLWGSAFMCNDFTWAFNLITISNCWIMLYVQVLSHAEVQHQFLLLGLRDIPADA